VTAARLTEPLTASSSPDGPRLSAAEVLVHLATATASLPVVGRWLRPLGAATAMGLWGYRHAPGLAVASARAVTTDAVISRSRAVRSTAAVYERALIDTVAAAHGRSLGLRAAAAAGVWSYRNLPPFVRATARAARPGVLRARARAMKEAAEVYERALGEALVGDPVTSGIPFRARRIPMGLLSDQMLRSRYVRHAGLRYGPHPTQRLDVWRRPDLSAAAGAPVLLFAPGGGWIWGSRHMQAYRLLAHLAEHGWLCLGISYRAAPRHPWPAHIEDLKQAIAWARTNAASYGGDPDFLAVAGCSAGGHLASLAGLSRNDLRFQSDLPKADTSVDAVVSIYGRYDWEDRVGPERAEFMSFLERYVVQRPQLEAPEAFRAASPLARVRPDAPPFLIIHGTEDTVIPVAQARQFAGALRSVSQAPVAYAELPGAQHGFDFLNNERAAHTVHVIERFLRGVQAQRDSGKPGD
jgi:acetyl esterase/lipase